MSFVRSFRDIRLADIASVGGKNASLGELSAVLAPRGIDVPDGFAVTAHAYRHFLANARIDAEIDEVLAGVKTADVDDLVRRSDRIRNLILATPFSKELTLAVTDAYQALSRRYEATDCDVAVRSSATAEDLPNASFAGQQESFLNVRGSVSVLDAVRKAFASLFTPRAISYRVDMGFGHEAVALSVGVQKMVRSDLGSAGVIFTLDPETGHRGIVLVTSSFGLGESVVQGRVVPDQFYVHKEMLARGHDALYRQRLGTKEEKLVYDQVGHRDVRRVPVSEHDRARFSLTHDEVVQLARWAVDIEQYYSRELDERNEAVRWSCVMLLDRAHHAGRTVGICGQAPSDFPDFAAFLVAKGIDSISVTPDAFGRTVKTVLDAERGNVERSASS